MEGVDQADGQGFVRLDQAAGEQDVLRARQADRLHQTAGVGQGIDQPQLAGGQSQFRIGGGDAQVAGQGQTQTPADAGPLDTGDGGFVEGGEGLHRIADAVKIGASAVRRRIDRLELADVGPRREGSARAAHNQHLGPGIGGDLGQNAGQGRPHGQRQGVLLLGAVEPQGCDVGVDGDFQRFVHRAVHNGPSRSNGLRLYHF